MEASQFKKTEPNTSQSILSNNDKKPTLKSDTQIKIEVTDYIWNLENIHNKTGNINQINITNENSNHFVINSSELPKGLTISSLD